MKIGLKLWSNNKNYIQEAKKLYEQKSYDYIELYIVPGTYNKYIDLWKDLNIPYIIHGSHFMQGINPAKKECLEKNIILAQESIKYSNDLKTDKIIFHPGIDGSMENTVAFFNALNDKRILVENKPYYALNYGLCDGLICNGSTPEGIQYIIEKSKVGFCFDIGHAVCSAKAHNINYFDYIKQFEQLKSSMYHFSDGDKNSVFDEHRHLGKGNYDLEVIMTLVDNSKCFTIETIKDNEISLEDFCQDIKFMKAVKGYE